MRDAVRCIANIQAPAATLCAARSTPIALAKAKSPSRHRHRRGRRHRAGPAQRRRRPRRGIYVETAFLINRSPAELFAYWRNFENLPQIMTHLEEVRVIDDRSSRGILRVLGVREICHGIDILSHRDPTPGVFARVAGDMFDGALLAVAAKNTTSPARVATAEALVAPVVVADMVDAAKLGGQKMMA